MPLYIKKPVGLKYVGSDTELDVSEVATETVIGQITIPASKVKTGVIAVASILSWNNTADTHLYEFKIRCGTLGTTSDTEYASQVSKTSGVAGGLPNEMGGILTYITGPDWTVQNYVSITVSMDTTSEDVKGYFLDAVVIGE